MKPEPKTFKFKNNISLQISMKRSSTRKSRKGNHYQEILKTITTRKSRKRLYTWKSRKLFLPGNPGKNYYLKI